MRSLARASLGVACAVIAAGCTGETGTSADPTPLPTATYEARPPLAVGTAATTDEASTTLLQVKRRMQGGPRPPAGQEWLGLRVRTCANDAAAEIGWYQFAAYGPGGERYPGVTWDDPAWPDPSYPEGELEAGDCAEGWIVAAVVEKARLVEVRFSDADGLPIAEWRL